MLTLEEIKERIKTLTDERDEIDYKVSMLPSGPMLAAEAIRLIHDSLNLIAQRLDVVIALSKYETMEMKIKLHANVFLAFKNLYHYYYWKTYQVKSSGDVIIKYNKEEVITFE